MSNLASILLYELIGMALTVSNGDDDKYNCFDPRYHSACAIRLFHDLSRPLAAMIQMLQLGLFVCLALEPVRIPSETLNYIQAMIGVIKSKLTPSEYENIGGTPSPFKNNSAHGKAHLTWYLHTNPATLVATIISDHNNIEIDSSPSSPHTVGDTME